MLCANLLSNWLHHREHKSQHKVFPVWFVGSRLVKKTADWARKTLDSKFRFFCAALAKDWLFLANQDVERALKRSSWAHAIQLGWPRKVNLSPVRPFSSPESSFPLTSGRKTRALGATISRMRHRCRLRSETGWAEFVISKWLLQELSIPAAYQKDRRLWRTRMVRLWARDFYNTNRNRERIIKCFSINLSVGKNFI